MSCLLDHHYLYHLNHSSFPTRRSSDLHEQRNWVAAFPFTALNILPLIAVLGAIGNKVESRKEIWTGCVGSGAILGVVSYIYNNSLIQIADELLLYEIPLFAILKDYPFIMLIFLSILLWFAIFTDRKSTRLNSSHVAISYA